MRASIRATVIAAMTLGTLSTASSTAVASDDEPDWQSTACTDWAMVTDVPTGTWAPTASSLRPVVEVAGVVVGVDRLELSGVTCEISYVRGPVPRGTAMYVVAHRWCSRFDQTLDGEPQAGVQSCSSTGSRQRLYSGSWVESPDDVQVLSVETFRAHDSVVLRGPDLPPRLVGATLTTDHSGSSWRVTLGGTTVTREPFERSSETDRVAEAAYDNEVARADRTFRRQVARIEATHRSRGWKIWRTVQVTTVRQDAKALARLRLRLALEGVRLVSRHVRATRSGTLPPA